MPVGTSDGEWHEDSFDSTLSTNSHLIRDPDKPLSQGPRIEIRPASVIQPPSNAVSNLPPYQTGPNIDPTMPIEPRELPVRERMDKVQGREASLENNAPAGNLGAPGGIPRSALDSALGPYKPAEDQSWVSRYSDAITNLKSDFDAGKIKTMADFAQHPSSKEMEELAGGFAGSIRGRIESVINRIPPQSRLGQYLDNKQFQQAADEQYNAHLERQNVQAHGEPIPESYRGPQDAVDEALSGRPISWRELPPDRPTSFDPGSNVGSEYGRRPNESWSDFLGRSRQRQREITERYQRENPNWMEQQPFEHEPGGAPSQYELHGEPMSPEEHAFMERMARTAAERARYPDYQPLPSVREQGGTLPDLDILKQKHYVTPRNKSGESAYDSHIMYKLGRPVADMTVYVRPRMKNGSFVKGTKELFVSGYYGIGDNPIHKLGADNIEFFDQLRKMYPETTSFGGVRVSGARGRAGTTRYVSRDWSAFDRGKDLALVTGILSGAQTLTGDQAQANEWKKPDLMPMGGGGGPKKVDWESVGIKQVQGKAIENKLNEGKPVEAPTSFWSYILNHAVQSGNKPVIDQIINVLKSKK